MLVISMGLKHVRMLDAKPSRHFRGKREVHVGLHFAGDL